ncbi:MAG: quinolinate synthase NadA [Desulfovibrionaceae bacterium]
MPLIIEEEECKERSERIAILRKKLGKDLLIVGHHYQNDIVLQHVDIVGDSLELARKTMQEKARHIVFCGVFFMAETTAALAQKHQLVHLPIHDAGCVLAMMAPARHVEALIRRIKKSKNSIIPLTYINSTLDLKALVGRYSGATCTSSNAKKVLEWAYSQAENVLFIPDKHLGRNVARSLGMGEEDEYILRIQKEGALIDENDIKRAKLFLWPGVCTIHHRFNLLQIENARKDYPGCKIVVHPESPPDVVSAADASGSTSFIIQYAKEAKEGESVIIGTEYNLVDRLAMEHEKRGVTIIPLLETECTHMAKITEQSLLDTLELIVQGKSDRVVSIEDDVQREACASIQRMLTIP